MTLTTQADDGTLTVRVIPSESSPDPLPRIFVWVNGGNGTDWQTGAALAEDGTWLAGHVSSSRGFFRHDMGLTSDWKHGHYLAHYPNGFELVEVPEGAGKTHEGLAAAYARHLEKVRIQTASVQP